MSKLKDRILNLFLDNIVKDITAADMRTFVNAVFDGKENTIRKLDKIKDITRVFSVPIFKGDLIVVYNDPENNGIYMAMKDKPQITDLELIGYSGEGNLDIPVEGEDGAVLSIQNGVLTWTEPSLGYSLMGTLPIREILSLTPSRVNVVYIAENNDYFSSVPGKIGDGYSWDGSKWTNVGQVRGPAGDATGVGSESELEKITENTKTGWRLLGSISDYYGDIGERAIDLSHSTFQTNLFGATGDFSFAQGKNTHANGEASVATGEGTQTDEPHSFVTGKYNKKEIGTAFSVGVGTNDTNRENAIEVYKDGRVRAPKLTIQQQDSDNHSFITTEYIKQLIIDCGWFSE